MKKSDMIVSMPMTSYEEMIKKDESFQKLKKELSDCFDTSSFDSNAEEVIYFDMAKAFEICKRQLSVKYDNVNISVTDNLH